MKCEGNCNQTDGEHKGIVKSVNVKDKDTGYDWGDFNYCQNAIETDVERGFLVKIKK